MFTRNLKKFREEKGLSQQKLSNMLNISQQAVAKWENGKSSPDPEMLSTIADILGVSADAILGRPVETGNDIKLDEIDFALFGEIKDLDRTDKEDILNFAKYVNAKNALEKKKE